MKRFLIALVLLQLNGAVHAVKAPQDLSGDDGTLGTFKYQSEEDLREGSERQEEQDRLQEKNKRSLQDDIDTSEEVEEDEDSKQP